MPDLQVFKIAVSAFIVKENSILILKRRDDETFLPGVWEVPGGGIDQGETIEQGVIRETQEEAGIAATVGPLFGYFEYVDGYGQKTVNLNFLCSMKNAQQQVDVSSGEMAGFNWITLEEFKTISFTSSIMELACKQALELVTSN